jgi:hypothetical protein
MHLRSTIPFLAACAMACASERVVARDLERSERFDVVVGAGRRGQS